MPPLDLILPPNFAAFIVLEVLICLSPGPAVLFVVAQSAWRGPGAGIAAALGINAGNAVYFTLSGLGLIALVSASGTAFMAVKWLGAAYLAWLGLQAIRGSFRPQQPLAASAATRRGLADGFLVQLANPKAILYFVALLPQFIDPSRSAIGQTIVLAAVSMPIEMCVLTAYALGAGQLKRAMQRDLIRRWFERATGGIFLGLAAMTALVRGSA